MTRVGDGFKREIASLRLCAVGIGLRITLLVLLILALGLALTRLVLGLIA